MKAHRAARVAEVIREVASETILFELQDPRVKNVTVTRAEVSGDLQHAKVFVSIMGSPKEQDLCMHGLRNSAIPVLCGPPPWEAAASSPRTSWW